MVARGKQNEHFEHLHRKMIPIEHTCIYSDVSYCVKFKDGLSQPIQSSYCVKQGCVLSPLLFNIFLYDFPGVFDPSCDPVNIFDQQLNCLMYADDLVLLSESYTGLQNCLNKLYSYTSRWNLAVNVNKTKVLFFNKGGHKMKNFKFTTGPDVLSMVQDYCYL